MKRARMNIIVQWRGGGYDGCFWEPNTGYFDANGEWHPVVSTGHHKRDTLAEFDAADREDDLEFPITPEGVLEFLTHIRDDFGMQTVRELYEAGYADAAVFKCAACGATLNYESWNFGHFEGYTGDGGTGVITQGPVCDNCFDAGQCIQCSEYVGADEIDGHTGACQFCVERALGAKPEIAAAIREEEDAMNRLDWQLQKYGDAMGRDSEAFKHQREMAVQVGRDIEDRIRKAKERLFACRRST